MNQTISSVEEKIAHAGIQFCSVQACMYKSMQECKTKWMLIFQQEETDTRLSDFYMSKTRLNSNFRARPRQDRETRCLFLRDREQTFNEKNCKFGYLLFKNHSSRSGRDQDEPE